MEHFLGYGEPVDVDEQLFIEKYDELERRKSELGELGMIGDSSLFKSPYEPQDRIRSMIGALLGVTPYAEHRTLPHMMDMTPGLGQSVGKNPYEPQDVIPKMIGGLGATYKCAVCGYKTNTRPKMLKHLARNTHMIKETFSV